MAEKGLAPENPPATKPLFEVRDFQKTFGNESIRVGDIDIRHGERVAILGASGRGKSTLLLHLAGLLNLGPGDGRITYHSPRVPGRQYSYPLSPRQVERLSCTDLGFVFQSPELLPHLNLQENIQLVRQLNGATVTRKDALRTNQLLDTLRVKPRSDACASDLSGGEASRVAFLRSVAHGPSVLLVDEPASDLDPEAKWMQDSLVVRWQKAAPDRRTVLIVTHDIAMAWQYATKFVLFPRERNLPVVVATRTHNGELPREEGSGKVVDWVRLHQILGFHCADAEKWITPIDGTPFLASFEQCSAEFLPALEDLEIRKRRPIRPIAFLQHAWLDFWRRGRRGGGVALTWGAAILLLLLNVLLVTALSAISGANHRSSKSFAEALRNPTNWVASVRARDGVHASAVAGLTEIESTADEALRRAADYVKSGFLEGAGVRDSFKTFRTLDPDHANLQRDEFVVALSTASDVFKEILKQTRFVADGAARIREAGDAFQGVILSADLARRLFGDREPEPWIEIDFGRYDDSGLYKDAFMPYRVLGVARSLPDADALFSAGFFYTQDDAGTRWDVTRFRVVSQGKEPASAVAGDRFAARLQDVESRFVPAFRKALADEFRRSLGAGFAVPDIRALSLERNVSDGSSYILVELDREVLSVLIERAVQQADQAVSIGAILGHADGAPARVAFQDETGADFDASNPKGLRAVPADSTLFNWWMKSLSVAGMEPAKALESVDAFVRLMRTKKLMVDTSLRDRVEHLTKMDATFRRFGTLTFYSTMAMFLITILVFLLFDSYRKVHSIAVLRSLGVSRGLYLLFLVAQSVFVGVVAFGSAVALNLLFGGQIARLLATGLDNGGIVPPIRLAEVDWSLVLQSWILVAALSILTRAWIFFRRPPGELLRY